MIDFEIMVKLLPVLISFLLIPLIKRIQSHAEYSSEYEIIEKTIKRRRFNSPFYLTLVIFVVINVIPLTFGPFHSLVIVAPLVIAAVAWLFAVITGKSMLFGRYFEIVLLIAQVSLVLFTNNIFSLKKELLVTNPIAAIFYLGTNSFIALSTFRDLKEILSINRKPIKQIYITIIFSNGNTLYGLLTNITNKGDLLIRPTKENNTLPEYINIEKSEISVSRNQIRSVIYERESSI